MALSRVRTWAVRSSTCASVPDAGAAQGLGPLEAGRGLVAQRRRAAALGDRALDVGPALVGVEGDEHVAGLHLLAFLELDLVDDAGDLGGDDDGFEGPHGADRLAGLDDAAGLDGIDLDRRRGPAPPARGRPGPACCCGCACGK